MAYRKFKAGKLFNGTRLLDDHVLITTESGVVVEVVPAGMAGDDVEQLSGWLCPGFINAHCHTELSHLKGVVAGGTGMVPFLQQVMFGRGNDGPAIESAIGEAVLAMRRAGIVAVGDICNTAAGLDAKAESGLYFHDFLEISGFVPQTAQTRFDQAKSMQAFRPAASVSLVPHAPYSVSQPLLNLIAGEKAPLLSIHNQESAAEDEFLRHKTGPMLSLFAALGIPIDFFAATGKGSLQWIEPVLRAAKKMILVHNCHTSAADIDYLKSMVTLAENEAGAASPFFFCLCPNANLYIGNPLPDLDLLVHSGIPICLGTDSLASNHQLDILAEIKALQVHFPQIGAEQLLRFATLNGAQALGIDDNFGSFEKGKQPGILLIKAVEGNGFVNASVDRLL